MQSRKGKETSHAQIVLKRDREFKTHCCFPCFIIQIVVLLESALFSEEMAGNILFVAPGVKPI